MFNFIKALSVFAGTIIGVGIFGLPYVASKTGFPIIACYFLFLSIVVIVIHLLFGRVALGTKEFHRLPGYVGEYLGDRWKFFSLLIISLGLIGALLAYLIVGGKFLQSFFSPYFGGSVFLYALLFFSLASYLIFRGIKSISSVEFALLVIFFGVLALFFIKAFPFLEFSHLRIINLKFFTLPYGVVLFSLWGSALVPEIKEMVGDNPRTLKKVIITGILLAAITYLFFIFIVYGVSGDNTSKEAISGLVNFLGYNIARFGFVFGIITCFTSFLALGLTLKKVFWYDFGLSKNLAWFIACFLPLFLFLIGLREFIEIISLTGAITIGAEGIIIVFLYREFLKRNFQKSANPLIYLLPIFFILGIVFEIYYFFLYL